MEWISISAAFGLYWFDGAHLFLMLWFIFLICSVSGWQERFSNDLFLWCIRCETSNQF